MASEEVNPTDGKSKQTRRGPAPFASFEDVSDEVRVKSSSPESKLTFHLPDIQEDSAKSVDPSQSEDTELCVHQPERQRSLSTPAVQPPGNCLQTPSTPRIDISRASSSSHHDSRDSSPEMALFIGKEKDQSKHELGFREDGALDLRSSTEELSFLEPNTATSEKEVPRPPSRRSPLIFMSKADEKRHSRKDSQCSDIVLLSISGRTSRLSSIGSQGSAHSNISAQSNISHISIHSNVTHISAQSRLSVISGVSRSPSPHKMLLETSFCGPKPIENEPDVSAGVSDERLLEMAGLPAIAAELEKESKQEIKIEVTIENTKLFESKVISNQVAKTEGTPKIELTKPDIKVQKELSNQLKVQAANSKSKPTGNIRKSREPREPDVYSSKNKNKNIIRIKLKPDSEYEDDDDDESDRTLTNQEVVQKPVTLNLYEQNKKPVQHFTELVNRDDKLSAPKLDKKLSINKQKCITGPALLTPSASPTPSKKLIRNHDSRTPSPGGPSVSRKSSFCSLFKSKEPEASPDSPSTSILKRKSVNEGGSRSRSKSRDRSTTPTSANKIKGSVLSLFKQPKKGSSPGSRASSPVIQGIPQKQYVPVPTVIPKNSENLKYYKDSKDGVIHIPLHTPPDEEPSTSQVTTNRHQDLKFDEIITHEEATKKIPIASTSNISSKPIKRTVLPDGSIIIPLHSPTEVKSSVTEIEKRRDISVSIETHQIKETKLEAKIKVEKEEQTIPLQHFIPATLNSVPDTSVTTITVTTADEPRRKKEHILFTTSVGSKEQIFSTQFSITKTPSLTSEQSDMFPSSLDSFKESKEDFKRKEPLLPETHITTVVQQLSIESTPSLPKSISDMEQHFIRETKELDLFPEAEATPVKNFSIQESRSVEDIPDSSESEISSELGALKKTALQEIIAHSLGVEEVEKKGLVMTQDSFEDELPYVPTTLPQERSVALPIVPVKERQSTGMKMYPIERPRSTTPIHPSCLEEYCAEEPKTPDNLKGERIKISLPKEIVSDKHKTAPLRSKSPRRVSHGSSPKPWGEFAEKGFPSTPARKSSLQMDTEKQPELPPRAPVPKPHWINFEEVPERRKMPKRIQTIPRRDSEELDEGAVVYNYVNPEDCKCECHENTRAGAGSVEDEKQEDEEPLLDEANEPDGLSAPVVAGGLHMDTLADRRSLISDSSLEYNCGAHGSHMMGAGHETALHIGHPFTMDLGVRSNRSSIASQDGTPADEAGATAAAGAGATAAAAAGAGAARDLAP